MIQENSNQIVSVNVSRESSRTGIVKFKQFSAWWVFGLSIVTLGIYPIYWLCTRAKTINAISNNSISFDLLLSLIIMSVFYYLSLLFDLNDTWMMTAFLINIVQLFLYFTALFVFKNKLQAIVNKDVGSAYRINNMLTFFFSTIYLQYKINQCLNESSIKEKIEAQKGVVTLGS